MNIYPIRCSHLVVATLLLAASCSRTPPPAASLSALTNAFPASQRDPEAAAYLDVAAEAIRNNDYAGGIVALQSARRAPHMTPEQLRAVQDTMQTLTSSLVQRAARGDAKAQADLAAIEKTRSQ